MTNMPTRKPKSKTAGLKRKVTVKVSVAVALVESVTVTVMTFEPVWRVIPLAVQDVVPVHVPLPPALFAQATELIVFAPEAVPPMLRVCV